MNFRSHISLEVADLDRAVRFYSALFAVEPTKHYPDYASFRLAAPALHLALMVRPERPPLRTGGEHFGIELFESAHLVAWRNRVAEAGLVPRIEAAVTCCYAAADKFWLSDPDGHEWEFWVRSDEADRMHGLTQQPQEVLVAEATVAPAARKSCCG